MLSTCKILLWNVWSVRNNIKLLNLLQIITDLEVSFACICETWFQSQTGVFSATIKEHGFGIIHSFRENKNGGGVAIIYKESLSKRVRHISSSSDRFISFEYSSILLRHLHDKFALICIYRRQEIAFKHFLPELKCLLKEINHAAEKILITGDFNTWIDCNTDKDGEELLNFMSSYGMRQYIEEPTHRGGHTLDQVYSNAHLLPVTRTVLQ